MSPNPKVEALVYRWRREALLRRQAMERIGPGIKDPETAEARGFAYGHADAWAQAAADLAEALGLPPYAMAARED